MGEVVVSSEEAVDMEVEILEMGVQGEKKIPKEGCGSVVRWERFLPGMVVRVLLVEADDSTRQIITALLRKCSYKVAAVPDGLKAWEVLKKRSNNIDLILTEVDLPSISGFALLTLIMEHETCKNIPVIMMSAQDSISMVYNCMLRGAADYLVKPIRINELKNLWQHVWRRQSQLVSGSLGPQNDTVAQHKAEATAENNAASYHSTGSKAYSQRQEDMAKKGSDAQSSCTKADLEAESANMEEIGNVSQQIPVLDRDHLPNSGQKSFMLETVTPDTNVPSRALQRQSRVDVPNHCSEACKKTDTVGDSSINLIGAFDNSSRANFGASPAKNPPYDYESSQLDLSLRRFHVSGSENNTNEKRILNHSDASAFSWYIYKPIQPTRPTAVSLCDRREGKINKGGGRLSDEMNSSDSDAKDAKLSRLGSEVLMPIAHKDQAEVAFPCATQQRSFAGPHLVQGSFRPDSLSTGCGSIAPPTSSPMQSPSLAASQQAASIQMNSFCGLNIDTINPVNHHNPHDQSPKMSTSPMILGGQGQKKLDSLENPTTKVSSRTTDQSGCSSLSNAGASHLNRPGSICGSNANTIPPAAPTPMVAAESGVEEGFLARPLANSQWCSQREAALTKFRLKRKERCFDKKVRYESRKKLAEQRPRVKGQFVRQVLSDPPSAR
ncbi:hypothetical protein Dimus_000071 [Dionaea muscipula]